MFLKVLYYEIFTSGSPLIDAVKAKNKKQIKKLIHNSGTDFSKTTYHNGVTKNATDFAMESKDCETVALLLAEGRYPYCQPGEYWGGIR